MIPDQQRLKIAVQKSGRLTDNSLALFQRCGLEFTRDRDHLVCFGENLPVDLLLVRDDDIPELLNDGMCEAGIAGLNIVEEYRLGDGKQSGFDVWRELDFGNCRLSIAVPRDSSAQSVRHLAGLRIATTYPFLTQRYLDDQGIDAEVVTMNGAVELAPRLGKADAICDLISTGATLKANQLRELEVVFQSRAALAVTRRAMTPEKRALLEKLERRMEGVLQVNGSKYIMLHASRSALTAITALLPGAESPTVLPLDGQADKVAVHAVCRESVFWETLENLKAAGASAILVLPIEKMLS
jgi:ATP phosphoribosyltransferase